MEVVHYKKKSPENYLLERLKGEKLTIYIANLTLNDFSSVLPPTQNSSKTPL